MEQLAASCIANMTDYRKVLLTCIIDLSEYIRSMVLWILFILPCRSGGKKIIYNLLVSAISRRLLQYYKRYREFMLMEAQQ